MLIFMLNCPFWCFSFQFMKFVKKLRDGEYTIDNNKACLLNITFFEFIFLFIPIKFCGISLGIFFLLNQTQIYGQY